jgi:hypothetical protein
MSQLKLIEMVMISTDGQAYVKLHRPESRHRVRRDWPKVVSTRPNQKCAGMAQGDDLCSL